MSAHTPGPWRTVADNTQVNGGPHDTFLARVHWGSFTEHQADANARLIAAAPEMLEALEYIASYANGESLDDGDNFDVIAKRADAAIRKAKGEL